MMVEIEYEKLKKILFTLEIARNMVRDDPDKKQKLDEYYQEVIHYVLDACATRKEVK